jgi:oligopeptide transport system substrate-binding protein
MIRDLLKPVDVGQGRRLVMRFLGWTGIIVSAVVAMQLFSCSQGGGGLVTSVILHRGISGEPSTLDPAAAADTFSSEVIRDLYEGLTTESPHGDAIPGVAASWTVDKAGTQYTFVLRPEARWSNGKPVRAQDFVAAWRRTVDPKQGFAGADTLRPIAGAASILAGNSPVSDLGAYAPSDDILVVKLEQPAPYFPQLLAHTAAYPIYSDAAARSHDPQSWVSNGPFLLAGWSHGTAIEIRKNPTYWDRGKVLITQVTYQVIPDETSQYDRYRAGELDLTDSVPPNVVSELRAAHSLELKIAPFLATAYYGVNLATGPLASDVKIRQALSMAIDRKRVVATLGFGQAPAYGLVPPGTWNYTGQTWSWKDLSDQQRIAQARQLYAEAGYSPKNPLHLRLLFNANPVIRNVAVVTASMWSDILGVDTTLTDEEYRVFLETRHDKSRWDVARLAWAADYNDAGSFLDSLRGGSPNNDSAYANHAFDALLDEAAQTSDSAQRRELLETSERIILADYPIIPLYHFVSKRLVKPYVHGVQLNPLNHIASKSLEISKN